MSAILIRILADGIIFGADRNLTVNNIADGTRTTTKVCKSEDGNVLIGSIGAASMGGQDSLHEIAKLVNTHQGKPLSQIATEVQSGVFQQRLQDDKESPRAQIVNLAGFEERDGVMLPENWYISNCYELTVDGHYADIRGEFGCSPEIKIKSEERKVAASELRNRLRTLQNALRPFGFQHSINLAKFNILDQYARATVDSLMKIDSALVPTSLDDWGKQVGLSLRLFEAYYRTFESPTQQFVGGGADVELLLWP
jgi:hypothetical protein